MLYAAFALAKKYCVKATAPSAEFARAASGTPVGDGGVEVVEVDAGGVSVAEGLDEPDVDVELGGSVAGDVVQAPMSDTAPRARAAA